MKLEIINATYHRNGISGEGFYAVLFKYIDENRTMIASLFDEIGYCAIYDVEQLNNENIDFANGNSWRGDRFESKLRPLLNEFLSQKQE